MFLLPSSDYTIKNLKKKGRGVFAAKDIPMGTVVGDYLGKLFPYDTADERKNGLYDMSFGSRYDILADPKKKGIHFINHACASNCDTYPYHGHMLFFALRKIFKGEELTLNYMLSTIEDDLPCKLHACHCGSAFCKGSMHDEWKSFDAWDALIKQDAKKWPLKVSGKYGTEFAPLDSYPSFITKDHADIYSIFGSEQKPALAWSDMKLPAVIELRKRMRETGRQMSFPKLHMKINGITCDLLIAEPLKK